MTGKPEVIPRGQYIRVFRAIKPAPGTSGPIIPGDPERKAEQERRKNGVPLVPAVGQVILQGVGFAIEHAVALLDGGRSDGLNQVTFAGAGWT
jgi:hypothetical protein